MATLTSCPVENKSAAKSKGCCDPCDASDDEPVQAAPAKVEDKAIVWQLDTEIVGNYPQSVNTVSLFEPEVDCCTLPVHLQPLCGGCPKKCDGNCGAKPEAEVVIEDAAPAVATATQAANASEVPCCSRPLVLQYVCGCPTATDNATGAAVDPFADAAAVNTP